MRKLLFLFFTLCCAASSAQSFKDIIIDESANGKVLSTFLTELEIQCEVDFIYEEKKINALTVTGITKRQRLTEYLEGYLTSYKLIKVEEKILFIVDKATAEKYGWRRENYIIFKESGDAKFSFEGQVIDGRTNDPLIGAKVYFPTLKEGAATDVDGKFTFKDLPREILSLDIQYVGYDPNAYLIGFSPYGGENKISAVLFPESKELESVTITAERIDENVISNLTGVEKLTIETLKAIPTFLGEVDPIRSITTLPGVSTSGELASGFNVRGGESGQNLILQDGAPIYNPSHLFGFFSSFNPDMVNNVTLYKGGGPANFGSRISSVLDISLKNGDAGKHTISGGIGLISSRLSVEGPILQNRSSYLLGGRISYCNWLVQATDNIQLKNSAAQFYDITAKVFHTFNESNFITLSLYKSYDDFKFATDSIFSWGTFNVSMKWDHTFSDRTYSALNVFKSQYYSEVESISEIESFAYRNSIDNVGLKYDVTHNISETNKVLAGFESMGSLLEPGELIPSTSINNLARQNMNDQRSIESAVYVQGDFKLSDKWSVSTGLRYSHFLRLGKDDIYTFDFGNMDGRYPSIADTLTYTNGEVIKQYSGLEPRLSLRYLIDDNASLKISYYRGYQYMHLISNTTSTTPQDYWVSSGPYLKPQIGDQYALGYFRNMKNNLYEVSVEGFYKNISNAIDYIEGADITLNPSLEAGLAQGDGIAYGLEFLIKKKAGKLNGWIAYTYSRSLRKFNNTKQNIIINKGDYYASAFDQPNNISLIMNYQLGARTTLSANFNYSTGRPITIPVSKFSYDAYLSVLNYSERNAYRIPDYHRLDLSLTIKDKPRQNKRIKSEWVISIFNVYSRNNAYSISFDQYGKADKLSILGSIFPSVTYGFRI